MKSWKDEIQYYPELKEFLDRLARNPAERAVVAEAAELYCRAAETIKEEFDGLVSRGAFRKSEEALTELASGLARIYDSPDMEGTDDVISVLQLRFRCETSGTTNPIDTLESATLPYGFVSHNHCSISEPWGGGENRTTEQAGQLRAMDAPGSADPIRVTYMKKAVELLPDGPKILNNWIRCTLPQGHCACCVFSTTEDSVRHCPVCKLLA